MEGFEKNLINLPSLLTVQDTDMIADVKENSIKFLIKSNMGHENYYVSSIEGLDIHLMNKQSIVKNYDRLKELA
jgi:hypothetical protein